MIQLTLSAEQPAGDPTKSQTDATEEKLNKKELQKNRSQNGLNLYHHKASISSDSTIQFKAYGYQYCTYHSFTPAPVLYLEPSIGEKRRLRGPLARQLCTSAHRGLLHMQ